MVEFIIALITIGIMGCFLFARAQAIRAAYEKFRVTLLSFFGDRGGYEDFEAFLARYKQEINADKEQRSRGLILAWIRFLDAVRIAQNKHGRTKFEGSEKALDKLAEDLRLAFPSMSRWQYVSPMVLSAIGVLGSCIVLLSAALGVSAWQNTAVYTSLMVCAGVAGMLLLKIYEQYTAVRVDRRIRIVVNHLRRHMIMRTEKDYLLETGRAIQDELVAFKELTDLLNLRVKRLADEQISAEAVAQQVKVDVEPVVKKLATFDEQLKHHLQDNKLIQNQQAAQVRDTLIEFFDQDRSRLQVSIDATKNIEALVSNLGDHISRNLAGQTQAVEGLHRRLDSMSKQSPVTVDLKAQFEALSLKLTTQLQQTRRDFELANSSNPEKPKLSIIPGSKDPQVHSDHPTLPGGLIDVVSGVRDLLASAERSCCLVVEQKKYLEKTLRLMNEMASQQINRWREVAPEFAEDLKRALQPLAAWDEHVATFKPVSGRIAKEVGNQIEALLTGMKAGLAKPTLKQVWLNADALKDLLSAGDELNAELGSIVKNLLKLQQRLLVARESLLFLETVAGADIDRAGKEILKHLTSELRATLRQRADIKFSVNHYARYFVPKVRAIQELVNASAAHFKAENSDDKQRVVKAEYMRAS
jgi:hypothetical protein